MFKLHLIVGLKMVNMLDVITSEDGVVEKCGHIITMKDKGGNMKRTTAFDVFLHVVLFPQKCPSWQNKGMKKKKHHT